MNVWIFNSTILNNVGGIFSKTYYGNTINQWLISFVIILGSVIIAKLLYWFFGNVIKKLTSKSKTKLDD
jgi:MscS family membrane protein